MSITTMTRVGKVAVVTRDQEVQVIVPVAKVEMVVINPGNKFVTRWFHDLTPREEQHDGLGFMRKREAIDAVMVIVRAQGWLPE